MPRDVPQRADGPMGQPLTEVALGQADADSDTQLFSLPLKSVISDHILQLYRHLMSAFCVGLNEHQGQFVTAVTTNDVRGSDVAFEKLAHCLDHIVPTQVSMGVVELLEIIDVHQQ